MRFFILSVLFGLALLANFTEAAAKPDWITVREYTVSLEID